tara:strand:+ start:475 stop:771 length:297 start_codon:yes stop_codon:yes gene_type:complete
MASIKIRKKHPRKTYSQAKPDQRPRKKGEKIVMSKRGPDMPPTTSQGFTKFGVLPHKSEDVGYRGKRSKLTVKPHKQSVKIIDGKKYKMVDGNYVRVK